MKSPYEFLNMLVYETQKNSTQVDRVYYTVSTYAEKTGPGNFLPYAFPVVMGQENDLSLITNGQY